VGRCGPRREPCWPPGGRPAEGDWARARRRVEGHRRVHSVRAPGERRPRLRGFRPSGPRAHGPPRRHGEPGGGHRHVPPRRRGAQRRGCDGGLDRPFVPSALPASDLAVSAGPAPRPGRRSGGSGRGRRHLRERKVHAGCSGTDAAHDPGRREDAAILTGAAPRLLPAGDRARSVARARRRGQGAFRSRAQPVGRKGPRLRFRLARHEPSRSLRRLAVRARRAPPSPQPGSGGSLFGGRDRGLPRCLGLGRARGGRVDPVHRRVRTAGPAPRRASLLARAHAGRRAVGGRSNQSKLGRKPTPALRCRCA